MVVLVVGAAHEVGDARPAPSDRAASPAGAGARSGRAGASHERGGRAGRERRSASIRISGASSASVNASPAGPTSRRSPGRSVPHWSSSTTRTGRREERDVPAGREVVDAALLGGEVRRSPSNRSSPGRGELGVGEPDLLGDPVRDPPPAVARRSCPGVGVLHAGAAGRRCARPARGGRGSPWRAGPRGISPTVATRVASRPARGWRYTRCGRMSGAPARRIARPCLMLPEPPPTPTRPSATPAARRHRPARGSTVAAG